MLVTFLGGANMLMTGILGVYVGRIYAEVKRRPLYVVDREAGFAPPAEAASAAATRRRRGAPEGDVVRSPRRAGADANARAGRRPAGGARAAVRHRGRRDRAAMPLRPARRRFVADHRRREMARRRDALSRRHRDQSTGLADALLAGGGAGAGPRRRAGIHGRRLRLPVDRRRPRPRCGDPRPRRPARPPRRARRRGRARRLRRAAGPVVRRARSSGGGLWPAVPRRRGGAGGARARSTRGWRCSRGSAPA